MTVHPSTDNVFIGIDVGKTTLDVQWHRGDSAQYANRPDAIAELARRLLAGPKVTRIAIEPIQHILPTEQHIVSRRAVVLRGIKRLGGAQVRPLDGKGRGGPSTGQFHGFFYIQIAGHLLERANRLVQSGLSAKENE